MARVTLASDDPAVVDLAAIEVLLTTIDGVLDSIQTAVEALDNTVETDRLAVNPISTQVGVAAGAGAVGATTQRVTLASDDPAVVDLAAIEVLLGTIDADTSTLVNTVQAEDGAHSNAHQGFRVMVVRQDTPGNLSGTDGDYEFLQVSAGRLWTSGVITGTVTIDGSGVTQPVSAASLPLPTGASTAAKQPALGTAGSASTDVITVQGIASMTALAVDGSAVTQPVSGTVTANLGAVDNAVLDAIQAAVETIDNAISGSEMQVDLVAALPAGTNDIGVVGHNVTNLADGVTTVTTAGTDVALAGSTAAKWVIIQAQTDNTGFIAVGNTGVDATVATGTGILLAPGESVTLPCDNLADIFIDSTVNGEGVRYTYFT